MNRSDSNTYILRRDFIMYGFAIDPITGYPTPTTPSNGFYPTQQVVPQACYQKPPCYTYPPDPRYFQQQPQTVNVEGAKTKEVICPIVINRVNDVVAANNQLTDIIKFNISRAEAELADLSRFDDNNEWEDGFVINSSLVEAIDRINAYLNVVKLSTIAYVKMNSTVIASNTDAVNAYNKAIDSVNEL
jgi:hypothetical protein